jgi:hypothetical protein
MRAAIIDNGLISLDSGNFDPAVPEGSTLVTWLTKTDPFALGIGRMPLDAPIPDGDIHLIEDWIRGPVQKRDDGTTCSATKACASGDTCEIPTGATVGECFNITYVAPAKGAQCNPKKLGGLACIGRNLYQCGSDWNVTTLVMACPGECGAGACL